MNTTEGLDPLGDSRNESLYRQGMQSLDARQARYATNWCRIFVRQSPENATCVTKPGKCGSNNDNKIKIGSNVNAVIEAENKRGLFIPAASLVHLGNSAVVFVMDNQLFRAHKVQTGVETNNYIEIISGLTEKDTLVENAQLLMDSESFIKSENK